MQASISGSLLKSFRNLLRPCTNLRQFTANLQPPNPENKFGSVESKESLFKDFKKKSLSVSSAYNLYLKDQYEEKRDYYSELGIGKAAKEISKNWNIMEINKKNDYIKRFEEVSVGKKEDLKAIIDQLSPEEHAGFKKKLTEYRSSRNEKRKKYRLKKEKRIRRRSSGPPVPPNVFVLFYMDYRKLNNIETKTLKSTQSIVKIVAQKWKDLDKESKEKYIKEYKRLLEDYKIAKAQWNARNVEEDKIKSLKSAINSEVQTLEEKMVVMDKLKQIEMIIRQRRNLIVPSSFNTFSSEYKKVNKYYKPQWTVKYREEDKIKSLDSTSILKTQTPEEKIIEIEKLKKMKIRQRQNTIIQSYFKKYVSEYIEKRKEAYRPRLNANIREQEKPNLCHTKMGIASKKNNFYERFFINFSNFINSINICGWILRRLNFKYIESLLPEQFKKKL